MDLVNDNSTQSRQPQARSETAKSSPDNVQEPQSDWSRDHTNLVMSMPFSFAHTLWNWFSQAPSTDTSADRAGTCNEHNVIPVQAVSGGSPLHPLDVSSFFTAPATTGLAYCFNPLDRNVPSWLAIDPLTGLITGIPPARPSDSTTNPMAPFMVTVLAIDENDAIQSRTLILEVQDDVEENHRTLHHIPGPH